jgi:putative ABC transport system permease protein
MGIVAAGLKRSVVVDDVMHIAVDSLRADRSRFLLTSLGMVLGTASLILVVTIVISGRDYVLRSIQNIGTNLIWVEYAGLADASATAGNDFLTSRDMAAVKEQVPGIVAASPVVNLHETVSIANGVQLSLLVLGVDPQYEEIRRLEVVSGRFFDAQDATERNKTALLTEKLAVKLFGNQQDALGKTLSFSGVPFVVVGVFRERTNTYDQTEIVGDTVLIPYTVGRYFTDTDAVNQIYFSMTNLNDVPEATRQIAQVVSARHRPASVYDVGNLTDVISVAQKTATAVSVLLLLFSAVTLVVSGVGILNIMLATVSSRIREIGIRKAVGATQGEIRMQFLIEAVLISLGGGILGTILGLSVPAVLGFFGGFAPDFSGWSVVVALVASCVIGVVFGVVPATRAARMDPVESLKYE